MCEQAGTRNEPGPLPRVADYVFQHAAQHPRRLASVWRDQRMDYGTLAATARRMGSALIAAGVRKGDRVAMLSTPRPEFALLFLAASAIGAVWLGLHPRYRLGELRHV